MFVRRIKQVLSWALVLTMLFGCLAQAEGFEGLEEIDSTDMPFADGTESVEEPAANEYVQFVCKPSQMKLTVISLSAEGEDSLSAKEKKAMLSSWDGKSVRVSRGDASYQVKRYAPISGQKHAYSLAKGMYFVRAEAKGYASLNWTAVAVRYEDGPMEMKLNLSKASEATAKPAATKAPEVDAAVNTGDVSVLPKDENAMETQRVVFWCDPAKMSLSVYRKADGEKMFPAAVSGTDDYSGMDLVAVAEYAYDLRAGEYVYSAKCDGYIPQENITFTVADEAVMIDLSLKSEIRFVDVTIILPSDQTVAKLYKASDSSERSIPAADDGVFELAPGYYQCVVVDAQGQETVHNLTVSGEKMSQTILLQPLVQAERAVQTVCFEKWQQEIELTVYTLDDDGERVICQPDENGLYHLPVGPVWYDASADGYVGVEGQLVQVESTEGEQIVRVWLLNESRVGVSRSENVVIFAAIAEKTGAQPFGEELTALLNEVGLVHADYFYSNKRSDGRYESVYYGMLAEDNVWFAVDLLRSCDEIAFAEPDYLYFTTEAADADIDASWHKGDQGYREYQTWLDAQGVREIWGDLERKGITPGAGVVVAVIDTGVDYTHPDLRANMWVNWQESGGIAGVDDDGNGYVDDVYGYDFVSNDPNPMDDHGHGTHVAGIIAMADNGMGGVGLAYGAKVMAIKAAQATGSLSSSAIARAVLYAKANGADVINMSFGGYSSATIVENALKSAYSDCLLVAAAGNDGLATKDTKADVKKRDHYPSGYSYVLGVMATNDSGSVLATFSNWDGEPGNGCEYELAAPGCKIYSTMPGGRYARWSGTSMAAPMVSAAAAVMISAGRSGSRYLTGQLVGATSKLAIHPDEALRQFSFQSLNLADAMNCVPVPQLALTDVVVFDDPAFDGGAVNNGDGVVQNGETIELGLKLQNRWGAAVNVQITASSLVNGIDPGFITWEDNKAVIDAVGTYAEADTGYVYTDDALTGVTDPFRFVVGKDVAHNVEIPIYFIVTAKNGMDSSDMTMYEWGFSYVLTVENGAVISGILTEDTTLTNDRRWIIRGSLQVPEGITLTVEAGTHIHFERVVTGVNSIDKNYYPFLQVLGSARFNGTADAPIELTTDTTMAIVGAVRKPSVILSYTIYGAENYFQALDCEMRYVNIHGIMPTYSNGKYGSSFFSSALITFSYGEHLAMMNCRIDFDTLKYSKLNNCVIYPYYAEANATVKASGCLFQACMFDTDNNSHTILNIDKSVLQEIQTTSNNGPILIDGGTLRNSAILNKLNKPDAWFQVVAAKGSQDCSNSYWGTENAAVIEEIIFDSHDIVTYGTIAYKPFLTKSSDMSSIYPFVVDAWIEDSEGNRIDDILGAQEVTFHVLFNRDMNITTDLDVAYGPAEPYNEYRVQGEWVSARKWEGTCQINPVINYGIMYIYVAGGHAANDYWLETAPDSRHWFEISNVGAEALVLQSWAEADGIHLAWTQDDFDTLAGYNLYRGRNMNANGVVTDAVKINNILIPSDVLTYVDANVSQGANYHYYFTVVQTDFAESDGSNVTSCTALDMTKPVITHAPVASVIAGQSLSISATVTDNVKVDSVTLYARVQGDSAWTATGMTNTTGNLWYANVVVNGTKTMEYYIVASDGVGTANCGTSDEPLVVLVESGVATLGDVNADGSIDILDLMMMTQSIVGTKTLTIIQTKAADVNVDSVVDVFDLMKVAQYICGMIGSL